MFLFLSLNLPLRALIRCVRDLRVRIVAVFFSSLSALYLLCSSPCWLLTILLQYVGFSCVRLSSTRPPNRFSTGNPDRAWCILLHALPVHLSFNFCRWRISRKSTYPRPASGGKPTMLSSTHLLDSCPPPSPLFLGTHCTWTANTVFRVSHHSALASCTSNCCLAAQNVRPRHGRPHGRPTGLQGAATALLLQTTAGALLDEPSNAFACLGSALTFNPSQRCGMQSLHARNDPAVRRPLLREHPSPHPTLKQHKPLFSWRE